MVVFNAIACAFPMSGTALEMAGAAVALVIRDAIRCRRCGAQYSLIVPAGSSDPEVQDYAEELCDLVASSCGDHPPLIQKC